MIFLRLQKMKEGGWITDKGQGNIRVRDGSHIEDSKATTGTRLYQLVTDEIEDETSLGQWVLTRIEQHQLVNDEISIGIVGDSWNKAVRVSK